MNKLRDAHPDTAGGNGTALPADLDTAAPVGDEPTIEQIRVQYAAVQRFIDEAGSSSSSSSSRSSSSAANALGGDAAGAARNKSALVSTSVAVCGVCLRSFKSAGAFGLGLRRHHCRRCGQAVCEQCSPQRRPLPE